MVLSLGYFIGLKKSCLIPATARRFLGYICDSDRQAPKLQKLAGKTTSFALLVPAANLYSNSMYQAISQTSKTCSRQVKLSPTLRKEISHWRFLDSWQGFLPWRNESRLQVQLFSDPSDFGWSGCLFSPGQPEVVIRGYWDEADRTTFFYAYPGFLCQKLYEEHFSSFSLTFSTC